MDNAVYSGKGRKFNSFRMPGGEVRKTFKIFCGNLPSAATKDDLYYLFSKYGTVVEAVVMVGKYYGFVHMAYEEDGWKAIWELSGYKLHGKAMAVEASINSKQATPLYKQNIIGKGITSLDDFNDYGSPKTKAAEARERRMAQEQGPPFLQGESSSNISSPPSVYTYPTPYTSVAQPSPLGHTPPPPPLSCASPMPDFQSHKPFEAMKEQESPMLKLHPIVDANSNPIQETTVERQESGAACCGLCGSMFDEWQHKPKILICGHTFCSDCMLSLAHDSKLKCPLGCSYMTTLPGSGVSGLTTNYTLLRKTHISTSTAPSVGVLSSGYPLQNGAQRLASSPPTPMVCCTCLKIATGECMSQNHQVIPESQARDILRGHLQSAQDLTLKQLRQAMTMRAAMKERLESTLQCVEKFQEELQCKVDAEHLQEVMLQEFLTDLNKTREVLPEGTPIAQLIDALNKVQYYNNIISVQFNHCAAISAINNATDAIVIKLKQSALDTVLSSLGFSSEEAFAMPSSLEEHAMFGNNANVLLLYMLSDLLSTRMSQLSVTPLSPLSPGQQPPLQTHLTPAPIPTAQVEEGMGRNLTLVHSKVNDIKNHGMGKLSNMKSPEMNNVNVEHILQMTEAIEAGSLLGHNDTTSSVSSALSLGLTNLSLLASVSTENGKDDLEMMLDKKEPNPVSYVDAAKKPAKPTPPPPDTPTKIQVIKPTSQVLRPGKFPHCWMVLSIDGEIAGRIIFELRPDKAPRMCENFIALCTSRNGYGYKGTHFFKSGEGFLAGGDVENDDGTGGFSAFKERTFEADLCPLKDEVGMVRFKGISTSEKGRGMVGSQFMIWYGDRDFKKFSYSLVFGKVVDGLDVAKKAAAINVHRVPVKVEECGAI